MRLSSMNLSGSSASEVRYLNICWVKNISLEKEHTESSLSREDKIKD